MNTADCQEGKHGTRRRFEQAGRATAGYFKCLWALLTGRNANLFF